jgi:hypothetical protein
MLMPPRLVQIAQLLLPVPPQGAQAAMAEWLRPETSYVCNWRSEPACRRR